MRTELHRLDAMLISRKPCFDLPAFESMTEPTKKYRALDETDSRLLSCLRADPRETNKSLAEKLSVTELTVAARIRTLENDRIMKVMAQRDYRALGFNVLGNVDVWVSGRPVQSVAQDIAAIDGVATVVIMMGSPSLMLLAMAPSLPDFQTLVLERIAKVKGVRSVETLIYADIIKYQSEFAML